MSSLQKQADATDYIYWFLKSNWIPTSDLKIGSRISGKSVFFTIDTTDNTRTFNQIFCWFVHAHSDHLKSLEVRQILNPRQNSINLPMRPT